MAVLRKRTTTVAPSLLTALLEACDDFAFVVGPDGRYLYFNDEPLRQLGLSAEELIGRTPTEALGSELGRRFERNNAEVLTSGKPLLMEEWFPLQGEMHCFTTKLLPVRDARGKIEAVIGVARDNTQLKRLQESSEIASRSAEARLPLRTHHEQLIKDLMKASIAQSRQETFLASAVRLMGEQLDACRVQVFEYDRSRRTVSITHEWARPGASVTKDEMQEVSQTVAPEWAVDLLAGRTVMVQDVEQDVPPELAALLRRHHVRATLAIPVFAFDQAYGFLSFDDCRGPRKWNEFDLEMLEAAARIVGQRIERDRMQEEVLGAERLAAIGRLTASITHEINNPLQGILLQLEALRAHVSKQGEHSLDIISEGFGRIAATISHLMGVNRGVSQHARVDVNDLLKDVFELVSHHFDIKGVSVRWHLAQDLPQIEAMAKGLHQVFLNIFLNAVDSMEQGGEINITTSFESCHVSVEIQDTGCGIEEELLPYIFEPFFTTKGKGGTGLGLFVSHSIVSEHDGRIEVKSRPGAGTTVTILLPASANCPHGRRRE